MVIRIVRDSIEREYTAEKPMTLLAFLQENGFSDLESPCGGRGTCRKCRVRIELGRQIMNPLACQIRICNGMRVYLPESREHMIAEEGNCSHYEPDAGLTGYAAACDIGTTTVVCHLLDLSSGQKIATMGRMNAQKAFGADVISRIQCASEGKLEQEHGAIVNQINEMLACLWQDSGRKGLPQISYLSVAGNTVMSHLFAGLSPESIGRAPYRPLSCFGGEESGNIEGLNVQGPVYIAPAVAGYVGGDITSDLLAVNADRMEGPFLLLDIGTNGEMVIGTKDRFFCCAAAAGPALEGGCIEMGMSASAGAISEVKMLTSGGRKTIACKVLGEHAAPCGICGSGLTDALALMLENGVIDETGRFSDECPEQLQHYLRGNPAGETVFYLTEEVYISQADIRQVQLAKAAVAAGIRILMKESGIRECEVSQLILAGGFGSFLNPRSAAVIGLFPKTLLPKVKAVGNAAGEGAVSAAWSASAREKLTELKQKCTYIELSSHPDFTEYYVDEMSFDADGK